MWAYRMRDENGNPPIPRSIHLRGPNEVLIYLLDCGKLYGRKHYLNWGHHTDGGTIDSASMWPRERKNGKEASILLCEQGFSVL